jgi:hypothetical protein
VCRRPLVVLDEHASALDHGANGERIVGGTGAGERAIDVRVEEKGVGLAGGRAVGDAEDDVGEISVGLVEALAHHVEPASIILAHAERRKEGSTHR